MAETACVLSGARLKTGNFHFSLFSGSLRKIQLQGWLNDKTLLRLYSTLFFWLRLLQTLVVWIFKGSFPLFVIWLQLWVQKFFRVDFLLNLICLPWRPVLEFLRNSGWGFFVYFLGDTMYSTFSSWHTWKFSVGRPFNLLVIKSNFKQFIVFGQLSQKPWFFLPEDLGLTNVVFKEDDKTEDFIGHAEMWLLISLM